MSRPTNEVVTEEDQETKVPKRFKVYLLNDDYTTMDFVTYILVTVFHKSEQEANTLMLAVHNNGRGFCGSFSREIAETKVAITMEIARQHDHPLRCIMEED